MRKSLIFLVVVSVLSTWVIAPGPARADCDAAKKLFDQALPTRDNQAKISLLKKAVGLCPSHAEAWNNLGVAYEEAGNLPLAERMLKQALAVSPNFSLPLAGLGDVALTQGNFKEAAKYYRRFLDIIPKEIERGDPYGVARHEKSYKIKYDRVKEKEEIYLASMRGVVPKEELLRGLRGPALRSLSDKPVQERLPLAIQFEYDSDKLISKSKEQLKELASLLLVSGDLVESKLMVEGYTDNLGSEQYNLDLSLRRAKSVKEYLVSQGVPASHLEVKGFGPQRLRVTTGSIEEQAENRRVEFVDQGPVKK